MTMSECCSLFSNGQQCVPYCQTFTKTTTAQWCSWAKSDPSALPTHMQIWEIIQCMLV